MDDKIKQYLMNLRIDDFEKFEYLKDFLEFIEIGFNLSQIEVELLQDEVQKLSEANERLRIECSKANGIYQMDTRLF